MRQLLRMMACAAVLGIAVPAPPVLAAGPTNGSHEPGKGGDKAADQGAEPELTPEQKFQRRFPQPAQVGHLIGLPVLDENDSTIGYVREVVRGTDGKISLIVPYSPWFGWLHTSWHKRPVAVPIEAVALLALQFNAVDMSRDDFDEAPTWTPDQGQPVPREEKTLVALGRR